MAQLQQGPELLSFFPLQCAGHKPLFWKRENDGHVWKEEERREKDFYETVFAANPNPNMAEETTAGDPKVGSTRDAISALRSIVPEFFGYMEVAARRIPHPSTAPRMFSHGRSFSADSSGGGRSTATATSTELIQPSSQTTTFLVLQDLTSAFVSPSMVDIKLGTRHYGPDDSSEKRDRQIRKCNESTSASLGFRLCGMVVASAEDGVVRMEDKYAGRAMKTREEAIAGLRRFFQGRVDVLAATKETLSRILDVLEKRPLFNMYSVSLLVVYGAALKSGGSESTNDVQRAKLVDARLVDFAKTYPLRPEDNGVTNDGVAFGLRSIMDCLKELERKPN